jgi:DNA polymerase-3 subunit delta'
MTWNIIGHEWAVKRMQFAIDHGQLAQSHLIVGATSVGKTTFARELAKAVLSIGATNPQRTAALVEQNKHPDLSWLEAVEGAIKVDSIRDLMKTLSLSPVESTHRVAVINFAHLMTDSGKNAILKTLEEPNPKVILVLIAPSVENVLPTIASRCQILHLRLVGTAKIEKALMARGATEESAKQMAQAAQGKVGKAIAMMSDENYFSAREKRHADFKRLLQSNLTERLHFAEKLARADETLIQQTLDEWALYWREIARKTTEHPEEFKVTMAFNALRNIFTTQKYLQQNVNVRLAIDGLMLSLPRLP